MAALRAVVLTLVDGFSLPGGLLTCFSSKRTVVVIYRVKQTDSDALWPTTLLTDSVLR